MRLEVSKNYKLEKILKELDKREMTRKEMAEELKKQVDDLSGKVDALTNEVHSLRMENAELRNKIDANKRTRSKSDKEI